MPIVRRLVSERARWRPRPRRRRDRGFTLIEVMVALAIVAITLGAGLQAAGALTRNAERFAAVSEAQWCADNHLAGLRLSRQFPGIGDFEFECRQLGRLYLGKVVVRPTPNPNFRRVDASVSDAQAQPLLTVSTVLGRF
ncbi:type II secretion system minor pseudopilin GspI [Piscinibacter sakaiensis]|uniref:type II secretion system minor pseudopilin GspI n=1 Tax=Piscinibacter sakaiensis TaxID=1547922 RepID=UPI003AAB0FF5